MKYSELVEIYEKLEATTKHLEKTAIIEEILKKAKSDDLKDIVYLLEGRVFPEWDERKIGFSNRLVIKAIASVSGASAKEVESLWSRKGDLGIVAEELMAKRMQSALHARELSVSDVLSNIRKLAEMEGEGTVARKISLVTELVSNAKPPEAKYIVKMILEELRVGTAGGIIRDAIAKAFGRNVEDVEATFNLLVDYGETAVLAKENKLGKIQLKPGRPLKVMLAVLVKSIEEAFEAVGRPMQLEYKLDGFRLQVHFDGKAILLFTRRMENVTAQFPDVVKAVKENVKGKSFIIDAEAVGYERKTGKCLPFQSISQRIKRKYDIEDMARKFPVELNVFDAMYYEGKDLMELPLLKRREVIEKIMKEEKGKIILTKKLITDDDKKAEKFYKEALDSGVEGVMLKNVNSLYKPGRYVDGWCKLKEVLEPLDLVIVGAEWGEGKRAKWLSSYTVACEKDGKLIEIGKVSTGMKEKEEEGVTFEQLTKILKPLIISQKGKEVAIKPQIVIEVGYEEIQKSPTYTSGYALRFPRVLRYRPEKPVDEIADMKIVEKIYGSQRGKKQIR
ncbi:MAG: ATP-dependent DNA ligase [Candidatus Woesearchaeota archaeon]|nr:ATP-dependent DNA ligase [Candidatus Woesearchaeota archaeon]